MQQVAGEEVLTEGGIQVATVLAAPDVEASDRLIYLSTPPTLLVNGTNFNAKHTALYFDPPLKDGESTLITHNLQNKYDRHASWSDLFA